MLLCILLLAATFFIVLKAVLFHARLQHRAVSTAPGCPAYIINYFIIKMYCHGPRMTTHFGKLFYYKFHMIIKSFASMYKQCQNTMLISQENLR